MKLSIIIAHYTPTPDHPCIVAVTRTMAELAHQCRGLDAEVIICDDGSPINSRHLKEQIPLTLPDGRWLYDLTGAAAKTVAAERFPALALPPVSHWLYLKKTRPCSSKARLWNHATELARSENLVFFDDDNYLNQPNGLNQFSRLLHNYRVVFGQVIDRRGRARGYASHRVQGTTFGIKKPVLQSIRGFGEWTEAVSSGIDSDLWFKLYQALKAQRPFQAAYTDSIQTTDACSKRWKPFVGSFFRHRAVRRQFAAVHGCPDYRDSRHNPSRNKSLWMDNLTQPAH